MRESMKLVIAGLVIGLAVSLESGTLVAAQIYGVQPEDPATLAASILFLLSVSKLASWIPRGDATTIRRPKGTPSAPES
jgi:hypothetical protein